MSQALPCEVTVQTETIIWRKGSSPILIYVLENGIWRKAGAGYDEGLYDINANFSLLMQNISIGNEDVYYCDILNSETGKIETQLINATVFGKYLKHHETYP